MEFAPAERLADQGVQLIDANGDGRMDLLVTTGTRGGFYPLQFGGLWDSSSFHSYKSSPSFDLEDPDVHLVDLNGDGVTDAIRSAARLECYFNDPETGWYEGPRIERSSSLEDFPNVTFSDPRVKWADMTGDGLQDIVLVYGRTVAYWPNLGWGHWGRQVLMHNSPQLPYDYDPRRLLLGDVDGDGAADLVYVDDTRVTVWINRSGNRWSDPFPIEATPPVTDMDAVRLVDMLGTGVAGILWSADAGGFARANMYFLDLTAGTKPYLLNRMTNNIGSETSIEYAPSTRFYLQDRRDNQWKTPLPFPVHVVAGVTSSDAFSDATLTTEYDYHYGYWDGVERKFHGFGRVDQRDTEVFAGGEFYSPPTETRT